MASLGLTKQSSLVVSVGKLSDNELKKEFDTFAHIWRDHKQDFKERTAALKKLQGMIIGGNHQTKGFFKLFMGIRHQLTIQILDLRDKVCKNACKVLMLLAEHAQEKFKTYAHQFVTDTVLYQLISTPTFRAHYGHNTIFYIVQNIRSSKLLLKVIEGFNTKNVNVREKTTEYMIEILGNYPETMLDKNSDDIEGIIKKMLADSSATVRDNARQCYQLYIDALPSRQQLLYHSLSLNIQKHLDKARPKSVSTPRSSQHKRLSETSKFEEESKEAVESSNSVDSLPRDLSTNSEEEVREVIKDIFADFDQQYTRKATIASPSKEVDQTIFLSDEEDEDDVEDIPEEHDDIPGIQASLIQKLQGMDTRSVLAVMSRVVKREHGDKQASALNILLHFVRKAAWSDVNAVIQSQKLHEWLLDNVETGNQVLECLEAIWNLLGKQIETSTDVNKALVVLHIELGRDLVRAFKNHQTPPAAPPVQRAWE